MNRQCQPVYYAFDILWLNGRDLRELSLLERKKILRKVIPRKSNSVGCVSYVEKDTVQLFELVKKSDLEGLVVKRKDGKYCQRTLWYKILNPRLYTEGYPRTNFFKGSNVCPFRSDSVLCSSPSIFENVSAIFALSFIASDSFAAYATWLASSHEIDSDDHQANGSEKKEVY